MRALHALLVISVFATGAATAEPISLKGLRPSMTIDDAEKIVDGFRANCSKTAERPIASTSCSYFVTRSFPAPPPLQTIAGVATKFWRITITDDKLDSIDVSLESTGYSRITDALTEKYGKPARVENSTIQNRAGAAFEQIVMTWSIEDSVLEAKRYGGSTTSMQLHLTSPEGERHDGMRRQERARKGASDL